MADCLAAQAEELEIFFRLDLYLTCISIPAILYAIPVEKIFSIETSNRINVWFLLIVALWRVALLFYFLRVMAKLSWLSLLVAALLPLTLIVSTLTALNLERAVFELMGGIRDRTPNDDAFATLWFLSLVSLLLFIPLVLFYVVLVLINRTEQPNGS